MAAAASDVTEALSGYTVGGVIGKGGFGEVRAALHNMTGQQVAIKILDRSTSRRWNAVRREIIAMKAICHPNIVQLLQVAHTERHACLVMTLCTGRDMYAFIKEERPGGVPEKEAALLFVQVAEGLRYLHARGLCHRDIKPANIIISLPHGKATIIDMGLAAVSTEPLDKFCGTVRFLAPEMFKRHLSYMGNPVDMWALGVTLYVLVLAKFPFQGTGPELKRNIIANTPDFPITMTVNLSNMLHRLLKRDPTKRPSAEEVLRHPFVTSACSPDAFYHPGRDVHTQVRKKVIKRMAKQTGRKERDIKSEVEQWQYDHTTAHYLLLQRAQEEEAKRSGRLHKLFCLR